MSRLRRSRWAPFVLVTAAVLACASEEERFQEHMARAETYREQEQLKEAAIELRSALKLRPGSAEVNERIARIYREFGQFENAIFFYRETQRLDPRRIEPLLGEFELVLGGDLERAGEIVKTAIELAPEDPRVQRTRSQLALAGGSTEKALDAALTAIELAPDEPANHLALGIVQQARMREHQLADEEVPEELYRSAIEAFDRADADDVSVQARVEKARTLGSWPGHEEEARAAFQAALARAIELESRTHQFVIAEEMALRARRLGDPESERQALEAIIAVDREKLSARERWALGDPDVKTRRAWRDLANLAEKESPGTGPAVLERLLEQEGEDVEAHLLYVRFLDSHGRREDALAHLEASADQGLAPAVLLDEAVRLSLESARVDRARRFAERLDREHPDHVHALLANARMAVATRGFDTAVELLGRANEIEESAESHRLLGMAEFASARLAEAQRAVGRSLELEPTNPATLALQARIHYRGGDWAGVLESLRRLRATGTRMGVQERLMASQSLYELGRNRAGRSLLDQVLKADPPPDSAVVAFARNEFRRDPETTARLLDEALARRPDNVALLTSATVFDLRNGEIDRALGRLDLGLEKKPNVPILLALRAQILLRAGRLEEAERDARQAFERRPEMPRILELLLAIYRQQGRVDAAVEQLEASESAGLLRPYDRVLLGRLHLGKGNNDRAAKLYEAALAEDPDLAGAKNDLAFLLAREGRDLDRALQLAQEARQALGEEPAVIDTLGYVMLRRGLAGPAAEQIGSAIRLAEERGGASASLHYHMGLALRALGQEGAAAERFEKALSIEPEFADAQDAQRQLEEARAAAGEGDAPAS